MIKKSSKYYPLYQYLHESEQDSITITITEVETLLGRALPPSAREKRPWWSNRTSGAVQSLSWMNAGYEVVYIDLERESITFQKPGVIYNIKRQGDMIFWDGQLVRALRHHMGLSQAALADQLSVRQQTISDWETGAYKPKSSTSKYLTLFAKEAGFTYGE